MNKAIDPFGYFSCFTVGGVGRIACRFREGTTTPCTKAIRIGPATDRSIRDVLLFIHGCQHGKSPTPIEVFRAIFYADEGFGNWAERVWRDMLAEKLLEAAGSEVKE